MTRPDRLRAESEWREKPVRLPEETEELKRLPPGVLFAVMVALWFILALFAWLAWRLP